MSDHSRKRAPQEHSQQSGKHIRNVTSALELGSTPNTDESSKRKHPMTMWTAHPKEFAATLLIGVYTVLFVGTIAGGMYRPLRDEVGGM